MLLVTQLHGAACSIRDGQVLAPFQSRQALDILSMSTFSYDSKLLFFTSPLRSDTADETA